MSDRPDDEDFRRYLPGADYKPGAPIYEPPAPAADSGGDDPLAAYEQPGDPAPTAAPAEARRVSRREAKRLARAERARARGERPRRSRAARGFVVTLLNLGVTAAVVSVVAGVAVFLWARSAFDAPGPLEREASIIVERGASFGSIVPQLVEKNIIRGGVHDDIFPLAVRLSGRGRDLQVGEFAFAPGSSMRDVMEMLTEGQPVVHKVTFPEGWTVWQMWERLVEKRNAGLLTGPLPEMPAEGSLLPATYSFTRGKPAREVVAEMRRERDAAVERIWESRDPGLPIETPEELVTLASIVEKETGAAAERAMVAGVFVNRLRKKMRLQSDPTIIYGIWGGQGKPKDRGGLRRSEIDKRTPYNTYRINGLPPGPIANPGREALRAVANPADTKALYFVADGTGRHAFADTLREHNRNVAKWRRIERERASN